MVKNLRLSHRDKQMLKLLSRCGVLSNQQVRQIFFNNTSRYHTKRLELLSQHGYIWRKGGYVLIRQKGLDAIGANKYPLKIAPSRYEHLADIVEVFRSFPDSSFQFGIEVKREHSLNRSSWIDGRLAIGGVTYSIYILSADPRPRTLSVIRGEIQSLARGNKFDRAVLFCPNPQGLADLPLDPLDLDELLCLPFPQGIEILKQYHSPEFHAQIQQRYPGLVPSGNKFSDYVWENKGEQIYITILTTNDIVKRYHLANYYSGPVYGVQRREVQAICYRSQVGWLLEQNPKLRITFLPDIVTETVSDKKVKRPKEGSNERGDRS